MEVESDTIPEEELLKLLAQEEEFTEEQMRDLDRKLSAMESELKNKVITPEKFRYMEVQLQNMNAFEEIVRFEQAKPKKKEVVVEPFVLGDGQIPLTSDIFEKLLSAVPNLKPPCPTSLEERHCIYSGYSTGEKHFLRVTSLQGELLYSVEIVKEFLSC